MDYSERVQRLKYSDKYYHEEDQAFAKRIITLLDDPKVDEDCMVDAYYYDNCVIPHEIQHKFNFIGDMYLIFGITCEGEIVSKWVKRYDLDPTK